MSANLRVVSRSTAGLAKVIHQINRMEKTEQDVIALLPEMSDEEVIETRTSARVLFACAWKIEIACDAEIWDRIKTSLQRSGVKDVDEKGIKAAVQKRAREIGCSASTVYANARLYRRFGPALSTWSSLDDKAFYQAAIVADDPEAKLDEWAEKKADDPTFRPADAWREVKTHEEASRPDETAVIDTPEVKKFLEDFKTSLKLIRSKVPPTAIFLYDLVDKHLEDVDWQAKRTVEGDCRLILKAIEDAGGMTDDEIYLSLYERGRVMREPQLEKRLDKMVADKQILNEDAGKDGKLDKAKGKQPSWYVPYYVKREKYKPEVEYGDEEDHY